MPQSKSRHRNAGALLLLLLVLAVGGAEYYRYDLTSRAEARERTVRQVEAEVAKLRQKEQQLAPDLPLLQQLEATLMAPKQENMSAQLLGRVLADQSAARSDLTGVMIGPLGLLGGANRHALTVQFKGNDAALTSYLRLVETGPAAARVVGISIASVDRGAGAGDKRVINLSLEYYSRAK